jgi:arabinose-5-phosphate isomerase
MVNPLLKDCSNSPVDCQFMTSNTVSSARRAIEIETRGLTALLDALDGPLGEALQKAVATILAASGRVIVSGMGKSGHIARKIAATMASTGTPASFVHPAEASHGDLGMITTNDVVIMLSNSGESAELKDMLNYCARFSVPMIAITANATSTMGRVADIVLQLPKVEEACPNGLAPTTSTLLQLALGDAIAMALLEAKGFSADDFRNYHPGGKLGAQIKHARDIMHHSEELPLVIEGTLLTVAIPILSEKKFGCMGVIKVNGELIGMVTDGDLRRNLGPDLATRRVDEVMTRNPTTVHGEMLAAEVIEIINSKRITAVFVLDEMRKPVGLIHIHDLLREGVS